MKKWTKTILGTVAVLSVSTSLVSASNRQQSIDVIYRNVRIVADGIYVKTPDEPFIYQGRVYLPIRAVAEALGQNVHWDNDTSTVIITPPTEKHYLQRPIANKPYRFNNEDRSNFPWPLPMTTGGVAYARGVQTVVFDPEETILEWQLNGAYSTVTGIAGIDEVGSNSTTKVDVVITGDGKELARFTLTGNETAQALDLNVAGINKLTFTATTPDSALLDYANLIAK